MSTILALDNLRGWADVSWEPWAESRERLHKMLDEIEAEIEERYTLLPLDADGMPIRVYDKLIAYNERFDVEGVGDGTVIFRAEDGELGELFNPAATIHAKPRTLEDVLSDFAVTLTKTSDKTNGVAKAVDECAEEIRELLGVEDD